MFFFHSRLYCNDYVLLASVLIWIICFLPWFSLFSIIKTRKDLLKKYHRRPDGRSRQNCRVTNHPVLVRLFSSRRFVVFQKEDPVVHCRPNHRSVKMPNTGWGYVVHHHPNLVYRQDRHNFEIKRLRPNKPHLAWVRTSIEMADFPVAD